MSQGRTGGGEGQVGGRKTFSASGEILLGVMIAVGERDVGAVGGVTGAGGGVDVEAGTTSCVVVFSRNVG